MKRRWRDVNRISFMIQIIASVLILLLVSAVLIHVYQASLAKSREAEKIIISTRIAKVSAEYFTGNGDIEDVKNGWMDKTGKTGNSDSDKAAEGFTSDTAATSKDSTSDTAVTTDDGKSILAGFFDAGGDYHDSRYLTDESDIKKMIASKEYPYVVIVSEKSDSTEKAESDKMNVPAIKKANVTVYCDGKEEYSLPCKTLFNHR
jgi:hypothetical protein